MSPFLAANPDVADDLSGVADTFPKFRPVPTVPPKLQTHLPRNLKALNALRVSILNPT